MLIICEGTVTEPCYFKSLKASARNPLVEIEVIGQGADPKRLVEEAIQRKRAAVIESVRQKNTFIAYNEIWCVFDVDDHRRIPGAKQQAADHDIKLAISNPSFELWALLHFKDQQASIHRKKVRELLKGFLPRYKKELEFKLLDQGYAQACRRAAHLEQLHVRKNTDGGNPSTRVHVLCALIRAARPGSM